jgi:NADH-quinone oxidoreductase subunit C
MPDEPEPIGSSTPAAPGKPTEEKKVAADAEAKPAKPEAATPAPVTPASAPAAAGKPAPVATPAAKPPAAPAASAPAKTAAAGAPGAAAKPPAAPPKPPAPKPDPWESPLIEKLRKSYGSGLREASTYMKQNYMVVDKSIAGEVLRILRDQDGFDYLVDVTAVHYPKREEQFDIVWILYSFAHNQRIRVKTAIKEGEAAPSMVPLWPTANWLEREVFDMFGIHFTGHPDLRRILMPEDWKGHPLRKDYGLTQQDQQWVRNNLGIESGQ